MKHANNGTVFEYGTYPSNNAMPTMLENQFPL